MACRTAMASVNEGARPRRRSAYASSSGVEAVSGRAAACAASTVLGRCSKDASAGVQLM